MRILLLEHKRLFLVTKTFIISSIIKALFLYILINYVILVTRTQQLFPVTNMFISSSIIKALYLYIS